MQSSWPTLRWRVLVHKKSESLIARVLHQPYLVNYQHIIDSYWPNIFQNMSGRDRRVDVRITHTVAYLVRCPRSLVPEAMLACKFSLNESESRSRQMTIRRSFAKKPPPDIMKLLGHWEWRMRRRSRKQLTRECTTSQQASTAILAKKKTASFFFGRNITRVKKAP